MWGKRKSAEEEDVLVGGRASPPGGPASSKEDSPKAQPPAGSAADAKPNGVGPSAAGKETDAALSQAQQGPTAEEVKFAVTFTRILSILMRSPHYKHYTLSDLEWLVVPHILTGQCAVMEARINGRQVPVAVALWATVSEEVEKRLAENLAMPMRLRPDEWRSGDILWLIDAVGAPKAVAFLLNQISETTFKGRKVKMRTFGPGIQPTVGSR